MEKIMQILGENFNWYEEDNEFFIEHPKWSLVGMGETLQDAHGDLIEEIKITKEHFCEIPDEELSEEAKRMKEWLAQLRIEF